MKSRRIGGVVIRRFSHPNPSLYSKGPLDTLAKTDSVEYFFCHVLYYFFACIHDLSHKKPGVVLELSNSLPY
jgi:hypothetical protein